MSYGRFLLLLLSLEKEKIQILWLRKPTILYFGLELPILHVELPVLLSSYEDMSMCHIFGVGLAV